MSDRFQAPSELGVADRRWAASGVAAVVVFALGLVFSDLLASPGFPSYKASPERIEAFFIDDRAEAIGISVCHALAAIALLVFVVHLHELLRRGAPARPRLATLALGGGIAASAFLLLSAVLYWTLTRDDVAREPGTAQALLVLSYLAGGQALGLSIAAPIGVTSIFALRVGALPRWIGRLGLVAAGLDVASIAWLAWDPAFNLLLVAAFLSFLWLFVTSIALMQRRSPTPSLPETPNAD